MYSCFFDVFSIGIGPSSSHTMGPMRAAARFVELLRQRNLLSRVQRVRAYLYGSLALTGEGHCTPTAVIYGLLGLDAETMDLSIDYMQRLHESGTISLFGVHEVPFIPEEDIILEREIALPQHANGMRFVAYGDEGEELANEQYFSIGGGAVRHLSELEQTETSQSPVPYHFSSCNELMALCTEKNLSIAALIRQNEAALRPLQVVRARVRKIAEVMQQSIDRGIATRGILPGGLRLSRRAPIIYARLEERFHANDMDVMSIVDWINLWAFAVSEENASGGRVVTAPTMGSAGIIPAVLRYYERYGCHRSPFGKELGTEVFLLTASAICSLYRCNASISGAEVGCQGEVGVACSMAAAGLTAAMGGTNPQVENAAEIAMEHNLGLTCDPVCGLVQVPCIERNAIGAVKAVNAARLALRGDGSHYVSLDSVIATMYETGRNLSVEYKETSLAGLARHAFTC